MLEFLNKTIRYINKFRPRQIGIAIYFFFLLISLLTYNYRPLACDMAEYLNNPFRVLFGDLPYIDFWLLFPPGEVLLPTLIYKIFGVNTDVLRVATILISCLVPVAAFYLGRLLFRENGKSIVAAFIFFFFSVVSNYEGPDYLHIFLLFIILAVYYLIKNFEVENNFKYVFLSGLFFALAFCFKLYEVGGVYAGMFLLLLWHEISRKNDLKGILKTVLLFISSLLLPLLMYIILYGNSTLLALNEVVFESVKNGTSMNVPYFNDLYYVVRSLSNDWGRIVNNSEISAFAYLFYHSLVFIVTFGYYIVPFIAVIIFIFWIFRKPAKKEAFIVSIIFIWGLMSFPKALGRSDLAHLAPSVAPFMLLLFYLGYQSVSKTIKNVAKTVVIVMFLSLFFPFFKVYTVLSNPVECVSAPNGAVPFKNESDRADFENTVNYILENTDKNDYIFVTPWDAPPIYALCERRNPTYYDSLNDLIIRRNEEKQKQIIRDILAHDTKLIIHNPDWGYDNKPEQQFRVACDLLQDFFDNECILVARFGFYYIYTVNEK